MSRLLQVTLATSLALGVHVAAFAAMPKGGVEAAAQAAGEGGASLISLAPAPADLAARIAAWETPPSLVPDPVAPSAPPPDALPVSAPVMSETPDLPQIDAPGVIDLPLAEPAPKADAPPKPAAQPTPPEKPRAPKPKAEPPKENTAQAETPKPAAPAAQKAKGKGKGPTAGDGGQPNAGALSAGQIKSLTADWGAKIAARIERSKRYPAKANGATGRVVLGLTVAPDGQLRSVKVKKSSGNAVLDGAAVATVKAAGRFAKAPKGVPETRMTVTLRFDAP